jgi:hypothetical protein
LSIPGSLLHTAQAKHITLQSPLLSDSPPQKKKLKFLKILDGPKIDLSNTNIENELCNLKQCCLFQLHKVSVHEIKKYYFAINLVSLC